MFFNIALGTNVTWTTNPMISSHQHNFSNEGNKLQWSQTRIGTEREFFKEISKRRIEALLNDTTEVYVPGNSKFDNYSIEELLNYDI